MKGCRPSACPLGSKPVRAYLCGRNLCRTSDRSACLWPGPRRFCSADAWGSFSRDEAPRPTGRTETAPDRPRLQTAPALHLLEKTGGPGTKPKETTPNPGERSATRPATRRAGSTQRPTSPGSRRKSLKRLNSRMESEGFRIWILFRRTLILFRSGFDFVPTHFEFDPCVLKVGADSLRRCGVGQMSP